MNKIMNKIKNFMFGYKLSEIELFIEFSRVVNYMIGYWEIENDN